MGTVTMGGGLFTVPTTHSPVLMLRVEGVIAMGIVRETVIFCPRCGHSMMADEGYLLHGAYTCFGRDTVGVDFTRYQEAEAVRQDVAFAALPHALSELAGRLPELEGLGLLTGWRPQSDVERNQASAVVLMLLHHLHEQIDALEVWHDATLADPEN